jgi:myo-inositol-hexaphosphate 3-phosphohydrolase
MGSCGPAERRALPDRIEPGRRHLPLGRRDGDKACLGRFAIGAVDGIDTTDESDGLDVVSAPLGRTFPDGLLVAHDGQDDPQFAKVDGEELENAATNFTSVSWSAVAQPRSTDEIRWIGFIAR